MNLILRRGFRGPVRLVLMALPLCVALPGQFKPSSTCKFLTPEEASAVIGPGAKLRSAIQDGACTYTRGQLTLTVAQPAHLSDRRILQTAFEASGKDGARAVAGVGDRAHIKKGNSGYQLMFLKGDGMGALEVYGEGSDGAAVAEKLTVAARKVAERF